MALYIEKGLQEAQLILTNFLGNQENLQMIGTATSKMVEVLKGGGQLFSCGNGGSMCDAIHFAEELTGRYRKDRDALRAMAISDPGHLSCVSNDWGYEKVFSRYLEGWARPGDCVLAISTSGNSQNIIEATEFAKSRNVSVVGLLGKSGGKLKDLVDFPIIVPSQTTDRIQEIHIKIIHLFIEGIERELFPENYQEE
jgi:D-sedoheptulose 7-phosphate isomerase